MVKTAFEFKGISKSFFGVYALTDISFKLEKGSILGLIGENGAGKSTLMNIMSGVYQPDCGEMKLFDKVYEPKNPLEAMKNGIAFVHQELNLFPNLSIMDNIFIENYPGKTLISISEAKKRVKQMLKSVGLYVSPSTLIEKLSPGQRQLVEIARCMRTNPDIVIFDEPTTSLTTNESKMLFKLINKLKAQGKSIIYISHVLSEIKELADQLVILRDGEIVDTGTTDSFSIKDMIINMVGRELSQFYPTREGESQEEVVLEVEKVSEPGIAHDISMKLHKGEILGIFGLMGSGRTEFIRMLFGVDNYKQGKIRIKGEPIKKNDIQSCLRQKVGFITEDRKQEGLLLNFNIEENLGIVSYPKYSSMFLKVIDKKNMRTPVESVINKLRIKTEDIKVQLAKGLSGGNQQKVVIAKWLMANPDILLVDEPTRGIDVGAKYEVYSIINDLADEGKSILIISSEIEELVNICDRILVMSRGEIVSEFSSSEFDNKQILAAAFRQI